MVAIDSHWDNNGIALWWEGIDIEVSHWIVERSTDADGPWEVVTIRTPSELLPEDDPLKYARVWDSKLPPGHHYYYRLFACTNEGRTGYSNVVEATVPNFMPGLVPPIKGMSEIDRALLKKANSSLPAIGGCVWMTHRPSHISKMVLPTVQLGPHTRDRTSSTVVTSAFS